MKEMLERAGINTAWARVESLALKCRNVGGVGDFVAAVMKDKELSRACAAWVYERIGAGQTCLAEQAEHSAPAANPQNGGQRSVAEQAGIGQPPRASGQLGSAHRAMRLSPPREPSRAQLDATKRVAHAHAVVVQTVLDTFKVYDPHVKHGISVGDIAVSAYARYTYNAGRRAWVQSREHNLFCLLKAEADKQAHIPKNAKTRDVFDAATVDRLIAMATQLATPKIEEKKHAA